MKKFLFALFLVTLSVYSVFSQVVRPEDFAFKKSSTSNEQAALWLVIPVIILIITIITGIVKRYLRNSFCKKTEKSQLLPSANESYFDGGLLSYIGWIILGFLVTVFTLGIAYPWALCKVYGWKINHTVINGKRLHFNGTALSLFGHWILWLLLTVITLGVYYFWLFIALENWKVKNTSFES
jgi:uncharacterized membrane protein YjgN (DUF898 family)